VVALVVVLILVLGGGKDKGGGKGGKGGGGGGDGGGEALGDPRTTADLKLLSETLLTYSDALRKGPSTIEDLAPYTSFDQRLLDRVRKGELVVIMKVSTRDLDALPGGLDGYIVAYERDAPKKGGQVVTAGMKVKSVTADEFKQLKLAKPEKK
jgi:hypothetical protein